MRQRSSADSQERREETRDEVRCPCGSLLARRMGDVIELKCRRCRRRVVLQLLADGGVALREERPELLPP